MSEGTNDVHPPRAKPPHIEFVDVTPVVDTLIGHSYIYENRMVRKDLNRLIRTGRSAEQRGLEKVDEHAEPKLDAADLPRLHWRIEEN